MKKVEREPYLFLANFPNVGYGLCSCCKYAEWDGWSCCEASLECKHPLDAVNGFFDDGEHCNSVWGEGSDCWGFRPKRTLYEMGIIAGIRAEGNMPHWSKTYNQWIAIIPSRRDREALYL